MPIKKIHGFSKTLIKWYLENKRILPWRLNNNAYRIWISEIMLQQTRVDAVIRYYNHWMKKWPTINHLSKASEVDVLNAWQGLGYYSRARNILKTASIIVTEHNGILPSDIESLMKLPGIGRYTSGAISSIAYGKCEPIVDGNVSRVYARLLALKEVVNDPKQQDFYYEIASVQLPKNELSEFNQGLMELGALVCTPANPSCPDCPVNKKCRAYKENIVAILPNRKKAVKSKQLFRIALLIQKGKKFILLEQTEKGLFYGLWSIPSISVKRGAMTQNQIESQIKSDLHLKGHLEEKLLEIKHTFTKYRETIIVYGFTPDEIPLKWRDSFYSLKEMKKMPMGSAHIKIYDYMIKRK